MIQTDGKNSHEGGPFRAVLFGASLDVGNLGVRALAASLIRLISEEKPGARITLFHGNRTPGVRRLRIAEGGDEVEVEVANFRLSPKAKPGEHLVWIALLAGLYKLLPIGAVRRAIVRSNKRLATIAEADFVGDIAGGDSFSDIYGMRRMLTTTAPSLIAILLGKELVLLPQTYGPYKSWGARVLARWILRRARAVYSRDEAALPMLEEMIRRGGSAAEIGFCPDVAFVLEPIEPAKVEITPPLPEETERGLLVGVNINGLLYMGGYTRDNMFGLKFNYAQFVERLVVRILESTGARVMLVPHVFQSAQNDSEPCEALYRKLEGRFPGRLHYVGGSYDQSGIKSIIRRCDFFFGSRMHPCIAALSMKIPAVGIAYSSKFIGVFRSVGAGEMVLDARELDEEELLAACLDRLGRREAIHAELEERIPRVRERVKQIFRAQLVKHEASPVVARDLILERQKS